MTTAEQIAHEHGLRLLMLGRRPITRFTFIDEIQTTAGFLRVLVESCACGRHALSFLWQGPDGEVIGGCGALGPHDDVAGLGRGGLILLSPRSTRDLLTAPLDLRTTIERTRDWAMRFAAALLAGRSVAEAAGVNRDERGVQAEQVARHEAPAIRLTASAGGV